VFMRLVGPAMDDTQGDFRACREPKTESLSFSRSLIVPKRLWKATISIRDPVPMDDLHI
jgi:hypothetical protein